MQAHPDIQYLRRLPLFQLLCDGLAELYLRQPRHPVRFLACFMLSQARKTTQLALLPQAIQRTQQLKAQLFAKQVLAAQRQAVYTQQARKAEIDQKQLLSKLRQADYPLQLLKQSQLQQISLRHRVHSYLAELKGLCIQYVGADQANSHMVGRRLEAGEGITWQLFEEGLREVVIEEVWCNSKAKFFLLPRLGAYLAFRLDIKMTSSDEVFDRAVGLPEPFVVQPKGDRPQGAKNQNQASATKQPQLTYFLRQYCLCFDTLGLETRLCDVESKLRELSAQVESSLNRKQQEMLLSDVQVFRAYKESLGCSSAEALSKCLEGEMGIENEGRQGSVKKEVDQFELERRIDNIKAGITKDKLFEEQWRTLAQYHHVKFESSLEALFYFASFRKEDLYEGCFSWRKAKSQLGKMLRRILKYQWQGYMAEERPAYAKLDVVERVLLGQDLRLVFQYNVALGRVVRLVTVLLQARRLDIVQRRERYKQREQQREQEASRLSEERTGLFDESRNDWTEQDSLEQSFLEQRGQRRLSALPKPLDSDFNDL